MEGKFLHQALDASLDIKVDYFRLDPRHPDQRPRDFPADPFKPGKYDVYILGDLDCEAFRGSGVGRAGQDGQPRGGPDHAGRLS